MKDDSFDCTLIAHLRIFLLFYRLLYCLILPENRLFFGIWKVVEIEWELDNRHAPDYVLWLLEYYIRNEGLMVKGRNEGGGDSEKETT